MVTVLSIPDNILHTRYTQEVKEVNQVTLLIDGDTFIYRYGLMNQDNEVPSFAGEPAVPPLEKSKQAFAEKLQFLLEDTGATDFRIGLANPGVKCYRYAIFPSYKGHRKPPPDIIGELKAWVRREYRDKLLSVPAGIPLETDDILGWHQDFSGGTVIVSNDKDMLTIPGWNYHPFTGELQWVTPAMADLNVLYQVLIGDNADGFPGAPGIGPKKASELLCTAVEALGTPDLAALWPVVWFAFRSVGASQGLEDQMYQLARIIRNGDDPLVYPQVPQVTIPDSYHELLKELHIEPK